MKVRHVGENGLIIEIENTSDRALMKIWAKRKLTGYVEEYDFKYAQIRVEFKDE